MPARSTSIALVVLLGVAPGLARAGGFAVARYAGENGNVTTSHPTAIYFNPAGLALGCGLRFYAEGAFALRTVEYDRPISAIGTQLPEGDTTGTGTPQDALDANSGVAKLNDFVVSPFAAAVSDFGVPGLGAGIGVHVPFGGQAQWDKNEAYVGNSMYPGAEDGVQRWSTIEGSLRSIYLTAAGAYRFAGPRVAVGVALNLIRSSISTIRARTATGTDDMVSRGEIIEGRSVIDTEGYHLGAGAGVMWEPVERQVWIGASYQSQPGFGKMTEGGTLTNKFGAGPRASTDIDLEQELPDITRLGVRFRPAPNVELRASGDYQRWSVFENQCFLDQAVAEANCALDENGAAVEPEAEGIVVNIPRRWKDTYGVRVGGSYWLTPDFEVNAGANYDTSAVPDETIDASLLDQDKLIAIAGLVWGAVPGRLLLHLTINNVFYFDKTVEARERDGDGVQIGPEPPSRVPDGAGTYQQNVFFVTLGAEARF